MGLQRVLGLKSYKTAWTWLHKLRRAMVRPSRDRLTGRVEVDETYLGGLEEGVRGRQTAAKALVVVAAQEDGPGIGRIRMRRIADASAESLIPFVQDSVAPGSVVHTDGWLGYLPLEGTGYDHQVTFLKGKKKTPSELMPRVHRVISLLKRWLMGTHQGAVSTPHAAGPRSIEPETRQGPPRVRLLIIKGLFIKFLESLEHLDHYLDEFTFRFNRRTSERAAIGFRPRLRRLGLLGSVTPSLPQRWRLDFFWSGCSAPARSGATPTAFCL